jgi:tetratricopeptide (TPR) repeat protein
MVSTDYDAEEIPDIINGKIEKSAKRIFIDRNVPVESDIIPGADTLSVPPDMKVVDYLMALSTSYVKTDEHNIFFNNIHITPLKRTSFYYIEVYFDCIFGGQYRSGNISYPRFSRKLTVEIVNEEGWKAYISAVAFHKGPPDDTTNLFTEIRQVTYDPSDLIDKDLEKVENRIRSVEVNRDELIAEGDEKFQLKALAQARQKFVMAREKDAEIIGLGKSETRLREIKQKIKTVDVALEDSVKLVRDKEKLRKEALWEFDRYNFDQANRLCDMLLEKFLDDDKKILDIKKRLVTIVSTTAQLDNAGRQALQSREKKEIRGYTDLSDRMMLTSSGNEEVLCAEVAYRRARFEGEMNPADLSAPQPYLEKALIFSKQSHPAALAMLADLEVRQKKYSEAIGHLTTLTASTLPTNAEKALYYCNLGDLYKIQTNLPKALESYTEAVRKQNMSTELNARPFISKATLEFELNQYADCIRTCDSGLVRLPATPLLHFYKARSLDRMGRQADAGSYFRKAVNGGLAKEQKEIISQISMNYLQQGKTAMAQGKKDEAITAFTSSVLTDSNQTALFLRAGMFLEKAKNRDVIQDITALLSLNRKYKGAHLTRGKALMKENELQEALDDFSAELLLDSLNAEALLLSGVIHKNADEYKDAVRDFDKVMRLQPSDSVWGFLVMCAYRSGDFRKAIFFTEEGSKKAERNYNVYFYGGRAYFSAGDYKSAIRNFAKAEELKPEEAELHWFSANAFESSGDYDEALNYYSRLKTDPWKDTSLYRSALVCLKRKEESDYKSATTKLENYLRIQGKDAGCDAIGWFLVSCVKSGAKAKTTDYLNESSEVCSISGVYQFGLALVRAYEKNKSATIEHLEKALQLHAIPAEEAEKEEEFRFLRKEPGFRKLFEK